mgnify:CR=1 FL=1|tara:strand:+ start:71122 stop:71982 length:861 start_codon:yes stop_codon:yes gene_type:complete
MVWVASAVLFFLVAAALLAAWRFLDRTFDQRTWARLIEQAGAPVAVFDHALIASLPEPAQRYFRYTIAPGALLHRVVELDMEGELGLGTAEQPDYRAMSALQVIAAPYGFVWQMRAGAISGSDGATPARSWTRFWLFGLLPIVRAGSNEDHRRSAFGRCVAEGAFWAPASLLPGEATRWEPLDVDSARAIVSFAGLEQAVDITVAEDGRPTRVVIQRWSNENPEKVFCEQPFGGDMAEFREFGGYRLPTVVEGGNHFGTEEYFPFFKARVSDIRFPCAGGTASSAG